MHTYILTGDVRRAVRVMVKARTPDAAIEAAEKGEFTIVEEFKSSDQFIFDGGDEHIEVVN